jgi:pimeloyl-ACP methyl ester carboxylesterase
MQNVLTMLFAIFTLLFSSCMKLDSNLFNKKELKEYGFEKYTGAQEIVLDNSYAVHDSLIQLLKLNSKAEDEKETTEIFAVYIGQVSRIATDTVIVYCHGNKWHMDYYWNRAKLLAHLGYKHHYGVMMMDYRGFGMSKGTPTEMGMVADVDACMKWLKAKGLNDSRTIIYGFSLGGAAATKMAAYNKTIKPSKLILESPFAGTDIMVQDASQLNMPGIYFTEQKVDNAEIIKQVKQPFMWIHGEKDQFLNVETHGKLIYKNYSGSYKEAHVIPEADHPNVPTVWGIENYKKAVLNFVTK